MKNKQNELHGQCRFCYQWLLIQSHTLCPIACSFCFLKRSANHKFTVSFTIRNFIHNTNTISISTVSTVSCITHRVRCVEHFNYQIFPVLSERYSCCLSQVNNPPTGYHLHPHIYSLYVYYTFTKYMFTIYSLYVHCIFTIYNIQQGTDVALVG